MKRAFVILAACVVLFTLLGVSTFAAGPDTTPPVVWGFGLSATANKTVPCVGNVAIQVQAKASDLNGIPYVMAQYKRPGDLTWRSYNMTLKPDGYWRYYIPKSAFTITYVGTWQVRVIAYDTFNNSTKSGIKTISVSTCAPPTL
jgi:hypothetical protein